MRSLKLFMVGVILLASSITFADMAELSAYKAQISAVRAGTIKIKTNGMIEFKRQAANWSLEMRIKGSGAKLTERSTGTFDGESVLTSNYKKKSSFLFIKENIEWRFDWPNRSVTGRVKKDDHRHKLSSNTYDPLSFQVALRLALLNKEKTFEAPYLRYNRPQTLSIKVIGEEKLTIDGAQVNTIILQKLKPVRSGERELIWVAKDYGYVPLRYTTYKDDKLKDDVKVTKLWFNNALVKF